jgi:lipopolysaccharide assembly outer membrane protein LptD (OstA)
VFAVSLVGVVFGETLVTGDKMEIMSAGDVAVLKGHLKAVNDMSVMMANEMVYDRKRSEILASGDIKLFSKNLENESFEVYGNFAKYNMCTDTGKIWGSNTKIKYFMHTLSSPIILYAYEVHVDRNMQILSACNNVKVTTLYGTIYSDNAVFDKRTFEVIFKKDKNRPIADVLYDGKKGLYEADEMIFNDFGNNNKKIVMNGSVSGKIKMKGKI